MFKKLFYLMLIAFVIALMGKENLEAQSHVKLNANPSKLTVKSGEKFTIRLAMKFDKHWHTYSLKEQISKEGIGPSKTEINIEPKNIVEIKGGIKASRPKIVYDNGFEMKVEMYEGKVTFDLPVIAKKDLDFNKDKISVIASMQLCDTSKCLPPDDYKAIVAKTVFEGSEDQAETMQIEQTPAQSPNQAAATPAKPVAEVKSAAQNTAGGETESTKEIEAKKKEGIFSFLWFAMTAGALALLTPCVFPMVPITVSFFTKRAEQKKGKGLRDSIIYAIGIITTFTAFGFILAAILGSTGIQNFATNPWTNVLIAAIFVVFALNLFGAFEIQLPTGILNKLNSSSQGGGVISVLLMGLTFSLTSFTCTVPFVGSALISASNGEWFYPIIGMLGFSTVFAAPFFLLALFPSAMNKLPKAGGWMNNVKVVMGFLEIAAAMKFISNVDLVWGTGLMPRELFLAIWIGCGALITLYILGFFKLSHDSDVDRVGALRVIFAVVFASVTFYLISGLNGKPLGELDAFLPPPDYKEIIGNQSSAVVKAEPAKNGGQSTSSEEWLSDYNTALQQAKDQNKMLFVDFSGFTCTNCRWMELNMFTKKPIKELLDKMVKVRLYTDRKVEPYLSNKNLQMSRYKSIELPLYVILKPNEELIGTRAFTRDENEFRKFLESGLAQ